MLWFVCVCVCVCVLGGGATECLYFTIVERSSLSKCMCTFSTGTVVKLAKRAPASTVMSVRHLSVIWALKFLSRYERNTRSVRVPAQRPVIPSLCKPPNYSASPGTDRRVGWGRRGVVWQPEVFPLLARCVRLRTARQIHTPPWTM
jgi:hypothetical protein